MFADMNREIAMGYWHWTWLAQPYDLPERMIGADPVWFLDGRLGGWGTGLDVYHPEALADYRRCFADPATIHASCRRRSTPAAKTIAPPQPSIWPTTTPTSTKRSPVRCWSCGAGAAWSTHGSIR
jgi:hypothetical protein